MKRGLWILILVAILAASGWYVYSWRARLREAEQAAQMQVDEEAGDLENIIWASGKLTPVRWAGLSPGFAGLVQTIYVEEGEWVEAGTLLMVLDNAAQSSQVAIATAALAEAQAAHDKLVAGPTAAEIAALDAQVATAEAQVAIAAGQLAELDSLISAAETRVTIARRQYEELAAHPTTAELTVAEAEIAVARAGVDSAQAAYNVVRGDPQIAARPEALALQQATAAYEASLARADLVRLGPTAQQLAVAQSQIAATQGEVAAIQGRLAGAEANVAAALAVLARAQADRTQFLAGATPADLAMAQARILSAQAAIAGAQANLSQSQVHAPFAGQIGTVQVHPGELVVAGQTVILLGDTRHMYVETTDLRETDVVRLQPQMPVEITFDALPDRIFPGTITHIAPVSTAERGSTNYTVRIQVADALAADAATLRWGMTAFVNIHAAR